MEGDLKWRLFRGSKEGVWEKRYALGRILSGFWPPIQTPSILEIYGVGMEVV